MNEDVAARRGNYYLFGMGDRPKHILSGRNLHDLRDGRVVFAFEDDHVLQPSAYAAVSPAAAVRENEEGLFIEERGGRRRALSERPLSLPSFEGFPHAALLRTLHHDVLVNVRDGRPLPNILVYRKPWYRDAAMMAMVLEKTGNLGLLRDWVTGLDEPYDRNNAGACEPDNLGEALYLLSLFADASHPLVPRLLAEARRRAADGHLTGLTDGSPKPVYQTKWLKFGLRRLGLEAEDVYSVPAVEDPYLNLFWMDGPLPAATTAFRFGARTLKTYPYLNWAEAHTFRGPFPCELPPPDAYPITWEQHASEADYAGNLPWLPEYARTRLAAPHAWHAAEMFLLLHSLAGG